MTTATPTRDAAAASPAGGEAAKPAPVSLRVREADASDVRPLQFFFDAMLRRDYFLRRGQLAEMVAGRRHRVLIAEIDCVLVGIVVLTRGSRLVNVLVHPAYRGLGIGRRLVEESGAQQVRVKRDMSGGDPRGFYESLGFEASGEPSGNERIELMSKANDAAATVANSSPQRRTA